jgi:hypothetical protein
MITSFDFSENRKQGGKGLTGISSDDRSDAFDPSRLS